VCSTVTSPLIAYGLEHQPSPRGWDESSPQYMGRVRPSPGWLGQIRPIFLFFLIFVKRKIQKYFFWNFTIFPCIFYVILINIKQYFYVAKNTKSDIKIPGFRQNFQNTKKKNFKKKCFCAYGQVSQKLKDHSVFLYTKK
jgi:hypothetical protein